MVRTRPSCYHQIPWEVSSFAVQVNPDGIPNINTEEVLEVARRIIENEAPALDTSKK